MEFDTPDRRTASHENTKSYDVNSQNIPAWSAATLAVYTCQQDDSASEADVKPTAVKKLVYWYGKFQRGEKRDENGHTINTDFDTDDGRGSGLVGYRSGCLYL